jgi:Na+/melibiose symporter-like transporter
MSPLLRFWGSAAAACIAFTALAPLIIAWSPAEDRQFVWLLTVFTAGVMMALFGFAALISGRRSVGMRDIIDAGGVQQALERRGKEESPPYTANAAVWCVVTGALLIAAYFALWMALG